MKPTGICKLYTHAIACKDEGACIVGSHATPRTPANALQEAAREREIEERERKLGALMAEKGATTQKKNNSKVWALCCGMSCRMILSQ